MESNTPISFILQELGARIDAERRRQRVTIKALVQSSGVSKTTLANLWNGHPVKTDTLIRVLRALGRMDLLHALLKMPELTPMQQMTQKTQTLPQRIRVSKQKIVTKTNVHSAPTRIEITTAKNTNTDA